MKSSDYKNERIRNINTSNIEKITRGGLKKFISDIALEKATSDNDINQEQYVIDNTDAGSLEILDPILKKMIPGIIDNILQVEDGKLVINKKTFKNKLCCFKN